MKSCITDGFIERCLCPAEVVAEAWEGVAECLVQRLELEAEDGTLDTKKLIRATAGMRGKDKWVSEGWNSKVIPCAGRSSSVGRAGQLLIFMRVLYYIIIVHILL